MIVNDGAELQGVLKDADRKSERRPRQWARLDSGCRFFLHFYFFSAAASRLTVFAAALITTQTLFDADCGLLGAVIRVGRHARGFK
jgi:hypothetical protein